MAVIPKYISDSPVTPAISNARIDPATAAAPYNAAAQSSENLARIFGNEMDLWQSTILQKEKEKKAAMKKQKDVMEGIYKAQAMADVSIKTNKLYNTARQHATNDTDMASYVDQEFQQIAQGAIVNAPSQKAQIDLTKRLIGMRAGLYNKATNEQVAIGNQDSMNKLENILGQFEGEASSNPARALELKGMSEDIFGAMGSLGVPARQVDEIKQKFNRNLEFHAARAEIDQDPLTGVTRAGNLDFAHLGPNAAASLKSYAETQVKATTASLDKNLSDTTDRLIRGLPIDENIDLTLQQAERYGLVDQAEGIKALRQVDKGVAGMGLNDMRNAHNKLKMDLARGQLDVDPKMADKLNDFFKGNIESMKEDPLAYGELKSSSTYQPLADIQDFANVSPEDINARKMRALQMEVSLGVPSPALKKAEVDNLANQLVDADLTTKVKILQNVQAMGDRTAMQVSKALEHSSPALALAASTGIRDPRLASEIMQGHDKIKAGLVLKAPPSDWQAKAQEVLGDFMPEDPNIAGKYIEAAKALTANDTTLDQEGALKKASGLIEVDNEGIFTGNYKTVPPVPGMSSRDFRKMLKGGLKTGEDWSKAGNGSPVSAGGAPIVLDREDPTDFQFLFDGQGSYHVVRGGKKLSLADGSAYKIDLRKLVK